MSRPSNLLPPTRLFVEQDGSHVSLDTLREFEQTMRMSGKVQVVATRPSLARRLAWRIVRAPGMAKGYALAPALYAPAFIVLMSADFAKCLPGFCFSRKNAVYLFDAWPSVHPLIVRTIPRLNVNNLFLSSLQATELLRGPLQPDCQCTWIPEGIDPTLYRTREHHQRDIDVLHLGRRHDWYHERIVDGLRRTGKRYLYERVKGELVFPTREGFLEGLSRAKISVCVPSAITHPERAGEISTLTVRYLQSMASGCLVVGIMPYDMRPLFDYEPMIDIDRTDPLGQLLHLLDSYEQYLPLIEKNLLSVRSSHTWANRWEQILGRLAQSAPG
jgi:hypothetical protein